MKYYRSYLSILLLMAIIIVNPVLCYASDSQDTTVHITVLTVNDFHGKIDEQGKNPGLAKLAGYLHAQQQQNPSTIILSAGDMFQGSADSNLLYGRTVLDAMNKIGFAGMALGNHEFDWGIDRLANLRERADFPFLAANIRYSKSGAQFTEVRTYEVMNINGVSIGIIGLSTPETAYKSNPRVVGDLEFVDPVLAVRPIIQELRAKKTAIIILLTHLGCEQNKETGEITGEAAELAKQLDGIDLIITGHTHEKVAGTVNGIPIIQAKFWGRAVGKIEFEYDSVSSKLTNTQLQVVDMNAAAQSPDQHVEEIILHDKLVIEPVKQAQIGWLEKPLPHDKFTLSPLGQWTTDVIRQFASADVAFQNGGGLRTSLSSGKVTIGNLYEVLPFDNTVYTLELSGVQILEVLEYGLYNPDVGMLQFSGMRVVYDANRPSGSRVIKIVMADGTPLRPDRYYKVAINDFMAAGGDGYTMFAKARNLYDSGQPLRDILIDAFKRSKQVKVPGDNRLTGKAGIAEKQAA